MEKANVSHVLRGFAGGEESVAAADEALRFFVHWVGDMHQPLHMSGREKGGNGARVQWNGRVTSAYLSRRLFRHSAAATSR